MTIALEKRISVDEILADDILLDNASLAAIAEDEAFAGPAPDENGTAVRAVPAPAASLLRFITCGSVDDGKSTLIGRLLYETNAVFDDQMEALKRDSRKFGTTGADLDFALLVDGLSAEREQGITIDVAYRYFSTANRAFIIADTPGHEQYTRNMATGASQAELAVILVDARKGILPQTRRHSFITSMVGIKSVVVAINKMDLVGFSKERFEAIKAEYAEILPSLGFTEIAYVPLSAKNGDNVASRSPNTPWYRGDTLLETLEKVEPQTLAEADSPFRLPVQWVNRPNLDFRGYCGSIAGGSIAAGDRVVVLPGRRPSRVKAVYGPDGVVETAAAGEAVTLTLEDEVDVSRGDVIVHADDRFETAKSVKADLLWMVDRPLVSGGRFIARLGTAQTPAHIRSLDSAVDIHTYEPRSANALLMNEIGRITLAFERPIAAAPYAESRELGAFILIDPLTNETVALGIVTASGSEDRDTSAVPANAAEQRPLDRLKALWLGQEVVEDPGRMRGLVRFRIGGAVLVALIALAFGLTPPAAVALGALDLLLRPFLRILLDPARRREPATLRDPTVVDGGAGI